MTFGEYIRRCSDRELAQLLTGIGVGVVKELAPDLAEYIEADDIKSLEQDYLTSLSKEFPQEESNK